MKIRTSLNLLLQKAVGLFKVLRNGLSVQCNLFRFNHLEGTIDCASLLAGLGGSGDSRRKWEEKVHLQGLKMEFFSSIRLKIDQIRLEMDQKGLKLVFLYQKYLFFVNFVCGTYAFVGNNYE